MNHKLLPALALAAAAAFARGPIPPVTEGSLVPIDPYSKNTGAACPLKHTAVKADISGFLARVTVTQEFQNTAAQKIEAVYVFPLPQRAAVDQMQMQVGDRTVKAVIKKREEARQIYEKARQQGQTAALLDQERPNIFTQSVTNIAPGATVKVTISYVETLQYEEGAYEWSFPMVVGPRYIPGAPTGKQGEGWSPDTRKVPDASRITPKLAPPATRAGHDLSLEVKLDAGVPIDNLRSKTHEIAVDRPSPAKAALRLASRAVIPNKDFVLRYDVAGAAVQDAVLTHRAQRGGFFTLILQPPERVTVEDVTPKELVFVLDTSGSMSGFPIEKAKECMRLALMGLYPRDTFNLITFAGETQILFSAPVSATPENLRTATQFLDGRRGGGGTEMMKAIRAALAPSNESGKVRIVCFMTDGFVGNDMQILAEIRRYSSARIFSFGIGSSVNRFLLDRMAEEGRGEVEYVNLNDDGSAAARRFHERVRNPLLTDVTVDWAGLPVTDVYPAQIPDLFSAKPVVIHGRYTGPASGVVKLRGRMSGREVVRQVRVELPAARAEHDVLATLWARTRIDDLMRRDWAGLQQGRAQSDIQNEITRLGLEFRLMTQFTSFIAVEETRRVEGGKPVVVEVPVEMPEGVSHAGVFGEQAEMAAMAAPAQASRGFAGGVTGGVVGGIIGYRKSVPAMAPPPPPASADALNRPKEEKDANVATKLHPTLASILQRWTTGNRAWTGAEANLVQGDKVKVEVWLTGDPAAALPQLKALGFEELPGNRVARIRTGWIRLDALQRLAALAAVQTVQPAAR